MSSTSSIALLGIIHGLHGLVALGLAAAFFAIVLTVVRRHRPDAWKPLAAASAVQIVSLLTNFALPIALTFARSLFGVGMEPMLVMQGVQAVVGVLFSTLWYVLLAVGVARLAQPPRRAVADPVGPYR